LGGGIDFNYNLPVQCTFKIKKIVLIDFVFTSN